MAKTRSQTVKKEEEEDIKPTALLNSVNKITKNKITKRKPSKNKNSPLPVQQVKMEEDTDTKSLLQSTSKYSKRGPRPKITQEQINQLIHYIVNDNVGIVKASQKVKMSKSTGARYYNLYKNDPEKRIPLPGFQTPKIYTQEQIGHLIRYINSDKMSIGKASAKANMTYQSAHHYYNKYLKDPNHNIPIPPLHQNYTQDQKNEFIGYVINDKMSIAVASKKAKMSCNTARSFYHMYFKVQNPDIATPSHITTYKTYTQEQIKEVISYIVDDKMSLAAASRKANICPSTARKHYQHYLKDNNIEQPVTKKNLHTRSNK